MNNTENLFSKIIFYTALCCIAIALFLGYGLYSGANKNWLFGIYQYIYNSFTTVKPEISTLTKTRPSHFLQPARYPGVGVTVNNINNDDLILISGFFDNNNELRLIRRNGEIVARWPVKFSKIFPNPTHVIDPPSTDWNIDIHGALALPDGSIVFNFEDGGLVKLNRCGEIAWTLPIMTHHSVELAENGGFWVPSEKYHNRNERTPFPPFPTPFYEDFITKISDNGKIMSEISVPKLFYDNGLETILTSTGENFFNKYNWDEEIVHLNKIDELPSSIADDFPLFKAGDLLLSLRQYNLLLVFDPNTRIIKWMKIGPWKRQHDPEFIPGGKIILFNNNLYRSALIDDEYSSPLTPRISNIMSINPSTRSVKVIYGGIPGQELLSVIRGKVDYLPNGDLLITEFEGGRVFEVDKAGRKVWEYINSYDKNDVAEITGARLYPHSYFNVNDWSCQQ